MRIVDVDDGGLYAHMAMDSSGRVHIVHHQAGVGARYALERADGTFELRTVESGADLGVHASIALDGSDAPHIAYRNARVNTLRYARWTGGAFTAVQIDGTVQRGDVGWYVDVAMDAMDRPAFAYRNNKLSQLSYAFRSGSSSSYTLRDTTPASGQSVGEYPSMVIDDNGVAHIVHRNRSNNSLVYTSYRSGSFAHEVIDRNDNPGLDSQIGIMPNGDLVVAYYAYAAGVPRIARRVGSTWQVADIATGGRDLGIALGMAIDDDAALHLCLRDYDARTLYYAHVSASGDTQVRLVDGESDRGDFCSIAVADDGQVAIAYADRTRGKLMLARF